MYHSVHPDAPSGWGPGRYAVRPDEFGRHLDQINDRYDVQPLSAIVEDCLAGSPPDIPTAAITFDDGFRDNLTEALPRLQRRGIPATVFVAGRYLDGEPPYEYRLAAALERADSVSVSVEGTVIERQLSDVMARRKTYDHLTSILKFKRAAARDAAVDSIDADPTPSVSMLSADQLRELASSPLVEVGGHGYEHVPFTALSMDEIRTDIERCRRTVEGVIGTEIEHFSYPYGAVDRRAVGAVEAAGFRSAVATTSRRLPSGTVAARRFRLPRIDGTS
jgi:peptidoglycan/xylan/chitin deacetylase (PgdA/CDA1 family)